MNTIKSKATGFEESFQKSKNVLDRLYEREDFKKDIRGYRKMLDIKRPFIKMDVLDVRDKNFTKLAAERRKKYGSATNVTGKKEVDWYKGLSEKQLKLLNDCGKLLLKKYQKKLNFELPEYMEKSILEYLLYNARKYVTPLFFPELRIIYGKNGQPKELRVIKYQSTSVRDIRNIKPFDQWLKRKFGKKIKKIIIQKKIKGRRLKYIKPRWDKTIEIGKKIFQIEKKKMDYWKKTEELFGEVGENIGIKNSKDLGKEEKRRHNKYRQLKHRAKEKMGI